MKLNKAELNSLPFVSIVVPAYNEAKYIHYCLDSLNNLNYPRDLFEIIVVDNGSTDATVNLSKSVTPYVYICPKLNVSALRNYGAKKALGSILAFIDADCIADRSWLLNAIKSLQQELCITGSKVESPAHASWIEKTWFSQRPKGRSKVSYINSGNLIVPAMLFNEIGGFNEKLIAGEDYEFCLKARGKSRIIADDRIRVVHLGNPKTLREFLKREIWHGLGSLGSFKIKLYDKPLIGTVLFLSLTLLQMTGLLYMFIKGNENLLYYSTVGIIILITLTVYYRVKFSTNVLHFLQLAVLYYLYYLGRAVASLFLLVGKHYYRRRRNY